MPPLPHAPRARTLSLSLALTLLAGCSGSRWNGRVDRSGSLDAVTRPVGVGLVAAVRPDVWGLGVLESAAGEVIVADGYVWVGRAIASDQVRTDAGFPPGTGASWIALVKVPRWREEVVQRPLELSDLSDEVARMARGEGWDVASPVPFVVEGELESVSVHVIRGARPVGEADPPAGFQPFRASTARANGVLVGVRAPGADSALVLPGDSLHVHALLREPSTMAAHVDAVRVLPGARLRVPEGKRR